MTDHPAPGASLEIATVPNLRDLGGWPTPAGTVARGRLYRSAQFSDLAGADLAAFEALGIATVYDLRTEVEVAALPSALPAGIESVALDVLADSVSQGPAMLMQVVGDPAKAEELLGGGGAEALFEGAYRELISLPSARAGYRRFFADLAEGRALPALFHCTTGKDRTGWAAASVLLLLGASADDVMADFLLTNEQLTPFVAPIADQFAALGGDPALLDPVLGVRREYLEAALDEVAVRHGSIEAYVADEAGLGLGSAAVDAIRASLTEGP